MSRMNSFWTRLSENVSAMAQGYRVASALDAGDITFDQARILMTEEPRETGSSIVPVDVPAEVGRRELQRVG